jgi:hypothetical protein
MQCVGTGICTLDCEDSITCSMQCPPGARCVVQHAGSGALACSGVKKSCGGANVFTCDTPCPSP